MSDTHETSEPAINQHEPVVAAAPTHIDSVETAGPASETGGTGAHEPITNGGKQSQVPNFEAVFISDTTPGDAHNPSASADPPGRGTAADISPVEPSSTTSWFKKSCKEVLVPTQHQTFLGENGLLNDRGLDYEVGPDKVPTVFASQDNLWNGTPQVISYFFVDGNDLQHEKVTRVIDEWTWYANVVFHQANSAQDSNVRIRFNPDDGSWSYVGRQSDRIAITDATMNLAWLDKFSPLTANEKAVILHEFGHVLGLLHEHQSPAHGGYAVSNVQAALDLYSRTQGWSYQQIYDQVINVYKMSDVSNFSQVDTHSIMHYPQPKELTGLDADIPYNEKLTDLDKAYMILQYPRREMHPEAAKQGWSFSKALEVMGTPPAITDRILKLLQSDRGDFSGEISPLNIRQTIEEWCRATYKGVDVSTPAATISPAHTIANATQLGRITAMVQDGQDLCSTDVSDATRTNGPIAPAHAVIDEDVLWPLPTDASPTPLEISYIVRAVGLPSTDSVPVTKDQEQMIQVAGDIWSAVAGLKFVPAKPGQSVDLVIQFNNSNPVDPGSTPRSRCTMHSGASKIARRNDDKRKNWATLVPDINYNGIFPKTEDAVKYKSTKYKSESGGLDGSTLNMRSIIHELGHWLGLKHEYSGLYGYWMHSEFGRISKTDVGESLAKTLWATRYDAGSIMDRMGMGLTDAVEEIIKLKGLQPASISQLQDPDGNVISRVALSVSLSQYDEANIALLYPSTTNLVVPEGSKFQLKTSQEGTSRSVLETLLTRLQLFTDTNLESIAVHLRAGKWQAARKAYIDILQQKQTQEAQSLQAYKQFIADQLTVTATGVKGVFDVTVTKRTTSGPQNGPQKFQDILNPGISGPQHDAGQPSDGQTTPTATPAKTSGPGSFVFELYSELSKMFCKLQNLEIPGRNCLRPFGEFIC